MGRLVRGCMLGTLLLTSSAGVQAQKAGGKINCEILENGEAASGGLTLKKGEEVVWSGSCAGDQAVPTGKLTAIVTLDGALDAPSQSQDITIKRGRAAQIKADFATGTLVVKISAKGRMAAGMALIRKGGKQIGTLGSGVEAHLGAGTYQVIVRYRRQEKDLGSVEIKAGQLQALSAAF